MKVWLVNPWEPNPLDDLQGRLWRTGATARMLVDKGHDVTWWASNFRHMTKEFRRSQPGRVELEDGYALHLLPALGYRRNVSLARLRDHRYVAEKFQALAEASEPPDIILASYPTIDLAFEAVAYGRRRGLPVVVDIRDQWPDTYYDAFPKWLHWAIWLLSRPLSRRADRVFEGASAITGNGPGTVEWALGRAGRAWGEFDAWFPMGYPKLEFDSAQMAAADEYWRKRGFYDGSGHFVVAFLGTMTRHFDFDTILSTGRLLAAEGTPVHFVCCGSGELLDTLRDRAADLPNVHFPGWVETPQLHALLRMSSVGIAPYQSRKNFEDGITNKPVEYLSAGLPIATTLQRGVLRDVLDEHDCGIYYREGSAEQLASQLTSLHRDRERLAAMEERARSLFTSRFAASKVYNDVSEHLVRVHRAHGAEREQRI